MNSTKHKVSSGRLLQTVRENRLSSV